MTTDNEPWHLDRRVPVALILTILAQTAGIIWWASGISADVETMKVRQDRHEVRIERTEATANAQAVQLGRIEEYTRATQQDVARIIQNLEARP